MRKRECYTLGIPALLATAEESPVTLTYRGVNDHNQKLYEAKTRAGEVICPQATEKGLLEALVKRQREKAEAAKMLRKDNLADIIRTREREA